MLSRVSFISIYFLILSLIFLNRKVGLQVQYKPEPRKSGRPKNKHDYAALDDGIALSKRHIDRLPTLNITPENFKRIKGSELTLEWLENNPDSMTEPILIENPEGLDVSDLLVKIYYILSFLDDDASP